MFKVTQLVTQIGARQAWPLTRSLLMANSGVHFFLVLAVGTRWEPLSFMVWLMLEIRKWCKRKGKELRHPDIVFCGVWGQISLFPYL